MKDIVYEYVFFTSVEEIVIEHPLFQRLRFVFQNSCAYLTYPANQLTRFSHSLGVMHLGGSLFKHGIENASESDRNEYLYHIRTLIIKLIFEDNETNYEAFVAKWSNDIRNIGEFTLCENEKIPNKEIRFLLNYTWQALRIACLIHDVGHFPFSHIFEMAIGDFEDKVEEQTNPIAKFKQKLAHELNISIKRIEESDTTELHEFFGALILKLIAENPNDESNIYIEYFKKCLFFAEKIFLAEDPKESVYELQDIDPRQIIPSLHRIVSSDIDADRLDYVLRDAKSSGMNLGNFDYERIILNAKFFELKQRSNEKSKVFSFFIDDQALSSIEQFFNHRYLLYQHLYFHHNVSKYDGILIKVISLILELAVVEKNKAILRILTHHRFLIKGKFLPFDHIENYDDCWLRTCLQEIYRHHDKISDETLHFLLDTFLYRKSYNTFSIIKKSSDIDVFLQEFHNYKNSEISKLIADLRLKYKSVLKYDKAKLQSIDLLRLLFAKNFDNKGVIRQKFLKDVTEKFREMQLVFIHKDTPPKLLNSRSTVLKNNKEITINKLSLYLNGFKQIDEYAFKHYFGIAGVNIKNRSDMIQKCKGIIFDSLFDVLESSYRNELTYIEEKDAKFGEATAL